MHLAITKILTINSCGEKFQGRHLKQAIDYIIDPKKTQNQRYVSGINCLPQDAFMQMCATKQKFGKIDKRQGYHIVISFEEEDVEPSIAFEIVGKFVKEFLGERYEAVYSVHDDTLHRHGHIIFNSVDYVTGKKYRYEKGDWERIMQPLTNRLCEEYGLATIDMTMEDSGRRRKQSNWKEFQDFKLTWQDYIKRDLDACIMQSDTFEECLQMLMDREYEIKQNKYLAIKPKGMRRFCRCKSLGEDYTEEMIRKRIAESSLTSYANRNMVEGPRVEHLRENKQVGIQKIYYAKVCRMQTLTQLPYSKAWQYREEIRKLNEIHEQYLFLVKHDIHSFIELEAVKEKLQERMKDCRKERNQINQKKRRMKVMFNIADKMQELQPAENSFQEGDVYFAREHTQYEELTKQLSKEGYCLEEIVTLRNSYKDKLSNNYEKQNTVKRNLVMVTKIMDEIKESYRNQVEKQECKRDVQKDRQPER